MKIAYEEDYCLAAKQQLGIIIIAPGFELYLTLFKWLSNLNPASIMWLLSYYHFSASCPSISRHH